jgi:hypothetical protein
MNLKTFSASAVIMGIPCTFSIDDAGVIKIEGDVSEGSKRHFSAELAEKILAAIVTNPHIND